MPENPDRPAPAEDRALAEHRARYVRLVAQQLASSQPGSIQGVLDAVRALVGVQAQEAPAARLALRARLRELSQAHVEHALVRERSVVRTWCLRGTLHLVAAEDLGWLLALLGPPTIQAGRRRRAELGIDAETGERGVNVLRELLSRHGPLTRAEIAAHLAALGLPTAGQATIHLIGLAALRGVLCYGPERDGRPSFVALEGWCARGPALPPEDGRVELARRYLAAYGPATLEDFVTWSGLPGTEARAGWQAVAGDMVEVEMPGAASAGRRGAAWLLREHAGRLEQPLPSSPLVRLVPGYDPYLLGYRRRDLAVDAAFQRRIHPGGGLLHPAVLVDGRAAGTWRLERKRRGQVQVIVEPFEEPAGVEQQLEREIEDVERFVGEGIST